MTRGYRLSEIPSAADYRAALTAARPTTAQRRMLLAHADRVVMTANELAVAAGYASWRTVNMQYGRLGRRVAEILGLEVPVYDGDRPLWTAALAEGDWSSGGIWTWTAYPPLIDAVGDLWPAS